MTFKEIEQKLESQTKLTTQDWYYHMLITILFGMWRDYREINGARSE